MDEIRTLYEAHDPGLLMVGTRNDHVVLFVAAAHHDAETAERAAPGVFDQAGPDFMIRYRGDEAGAFIEVSSRVWDEQSAAGLLRMLGHDRISFEAAFHAAAITYRVESADLPLGRWPVAAQLRGRALDHEATPTFDRDF